MSRRSMSLFRVRSALNRARASTDPDAKFRALEEAFAILIEMLSDEERDMGL